MADNVAITPGTGAEVRAVNKGGNLTQAVVVDHGGGGAENLGPGGPVTPLSGTFNTSGDNTILAANASHYFVITHVTLQNESSTATTMQLKIGSTVWERVLGQNQGDGLEVTYDPEARPTGANNQAIILNLSGANSCGYTVHYYQV